MPQQGVCGSELLRVFRDSGIEKASAICLCVLFSGGPARMRQSRRFPDDLLDVVKSGLYMGTVGAFMPKDLPCDAANAHARRPQLPISIARHGEEKTPAVLRLLSSASTPIHALYRILQYYS